MTGEFFFFCSACSDLESPSGEFCVLETYGNFPPEKVVGTKTACLREYNVEQDWHWIPTFEALEPYIEIANSPMWEGAFFGTRPPSNEEQLWTRAAEQIQEIRACQRQARKEIRRRLEAFDLINQATPCRDDFLTSRWCK